MILFKKWHTRTREITWENKHNYFDRPHSPVRYQHTPMQRGECVWAKDCQTIAEQTMEISILTSEIHNKRNDIEKRWYEKRALILCLMRYWWSYVIPSGYTRANDQVCTYDCKSYSRLENTLASMRRWMLVDKLVSRWFRFCVFCGSSTDHTTSPSVLNIIGNEMLWYKHRP